MILNWQRIRIGLIWLAVLTFGGMITLSAVLALANPAAAEGSPAEFDGTLAESSVPLAHVHSLCSEYAETSETRITGCAVLLSDDVCWIIYPDGPHAGISHLDIRRQQIARCNELEREQ